MKFGMYMQVDDWCTTVCFYGMPYDPIQVQGHGVCEVPKIAIFQLYLLRHLQWQLANEH